MILIHWTEHWKGEALDCLEGQFPSRAVSCGSVMVLWDGQGSLSHYGMKDQIWSDIHRIRSNVPPLLCHFWWWGAVTAAETSVCSNQQLLSLLNPSLHLQFVIFHSHWQPVTFDSSFPHLNPFVIWPLQHVATVASPVCALHTHLSANSFLSIKISAWWYHCWPCMFLVTQDHPQSLGH